MKYQFDASEKLFLAKPQKRKDWNYYAALREPSLKDDVDSSVRA
jgi:hypothetical protein